MTTHQLNFRRIDGGANQHTVGVLELTGEIDATNARELDEALRQSAASGPIILDLSAVAFFDSGGFAVLDERLADGGLLVVIAPNSLIRGAASMVNLPFHDSLEDALAAISRA
jgi:anti-anti-sigma factor